MTAIRAKPLILLVDDDPDDVELTLINFKAQGFDADIEIARDGVEGLERLLAAAASTPPRLPDILLLDIKMPRMTGLELAERLRDIPTLSGLPVVILTSSNHERDREAAVRVGARLFVQKPVAAEEYARLIGGVRLLLETHPA